MEHYVLGEQSRLAGGGVLSIGGGNNLENSSMAVQLADSQPMMHCSSLPTNERKRMSADSVQITLRHANTLQM